MTNKCIYININPGHSWSSRLYGTCFHTVKKKSLRTNKQSCEIYTKGGNLTKQLNELITFQAKVLHIQGKIGYTSEGTRATLINRSIGY